MAKTYVRVDDRLIHGQTIVSWAPTLKLEEIIGIDDVSAANPTLRSILMMGVPNRYEAHIVTTGEAIELLSIDDDKNRIVIVKTPHQLMAIKDAIRGCEHIYLGNMAKRMDTNHQVAGATGIFFLSDQDIEDISALVKEGFEVTFQQLPNTQETSWDSFLKSVR